MTRQTIVAVVTAVFLGAPVTARGQGGSLDPQTQYTVINGPSIGNQHGALLAIVLWRGPLGWDRPDAFERARADSAFRWTRLRADEANQSAFGSSLSFGLLDLGYKAVTVEGKRFPLSAGDSALVIMVTIAPDNLPRTVSTASIASVLPDEFWAKTWMSGDTTFFVRPNFARLQAMLRDALDRSPAVASFLEDAAATSAQSPTKRDMVVKVPTPPGRPMTLAEFEPDLPAVEGPFECTGSESIGRSAVGRMVLGSDAVSFNAAVPTRAALKAMISVFVDSTGQIFRYVERRGPPIHPVTAAGSEPGGAAAQFAAAEAAARSTTIQLDYRTGIGSVRNHGGGQPDQAASGPVDLVALLEKFGRARARAERVLAQCRGGR